MDILQTLAFYPNYCIKNNFITPNSRISTLMSLFGILFYLSILFYHLLIYFEYNHTILDLISFIHNCSYFAFGYVLYFIVGVKYSVQNTKFVLTFQDVHRFLNDRASFRHLTTWVWVLIISYISLFLMYCFSIRYYFRVNIYVVLILIVIIFDLRLIHAVILIKLLEMKFLLWNKEALKTQDNQSKETKLHHRKMSEAFDKLFECYNLFKDAFEHSVSGILSKK